MEYSENVPDCSLCHVSPTLKILFKIRSAIFAVMLLRHRQTHTHTQANVQRPKHNQSSQVSSLINNVSLYSHIEPLTRIVLFGVGKWNWLYAWPAKFIAESPNLYSLASWNMQPSISRIITASFADTKLNSCVSWSVVLKSQFTQHYYQGLDLVWEVSTCHKVFVWEPLCNEIVKVIICRSTQVTPRWLHILSRSNFSRHWLFVRLELWIRWSLVDCPDRGSVMWSVHVFFAGSLYALFWYLMPLFYIIHNVIISALFNHDDENYYEEIHIHGYTIWIMELGSMLWVGLVQ